MSGLLSPLLSMEGVDNRVAHVARVALCHAGLHDQCPAYLSALSAAIDKEPPPFNTTAYSDLYRDASANPRWMAISLITNAEREGDGAARLWSLSAYSFDGDEQHLLKAHAVDESRHALFYLALLDLAFPGMTDPSFRLELRKLSPGYSMRMELFAVSGSPYARAPSIDDFIQMNIAEIRTTIHHLMQRPALAAQSTSKTQERMGPILEALLRDELRHVAYTAKLIEQRTRSPACPDVAPLVRKRLRDFNQITNEELGHLSFDCSVACCTKRSYCRLKANPVSGFVDSPI
jgi:hypothetical protein